MIGLTPEMLNNIEAENRLQNMYRYPESNVSTIDNRIAKQSNANPHLFDYLFDKAGNEGHRFARELSEVASNAWTNYVKPVIENIPIASETGKQLAKNKAIDEGLIPDLKRGDADEITEVIDELKKSGLSSNPWKEDYPAFNTGFNSKEFLPKKSKYDTKDSIDSLNDYLSKYKNLPKRKYAELPTREFANRAARTELPKANYYNENYALNPFKSVTDYTDNSYMNTLSALHPALAVGIGVSNMFTNPMKQKYFREREEYNKAEEARRKNEELRYERARQKYLDEFDRATRLNDYARNDWLDEQNVNDIKYNDALKQSEYANEQSKTAREDEEKLADKEYIVGKDIAQLNKAKADDYNKVQQLKYLFASSIDDVPENIEYADERTKARYKKLIDDYSNILSNSGSLDDATYQGLLNRFNKDKKEVLDKAVIYPLGERATYEIASRISRNYVTPRNAVTKLMDWGVRKECFF